MSPIARYDIANTYDWNYENAPPPQRLDVPAVPGEWSLCGFPVDSPLGVPAGPLLNGAWCLYYASLGFDVLTYKTVRSRQRECYPLPNLQPVDCECLAGGEPSVPISTEMQGSWAVSFGMPSKDPSCWQADVTATRNALPRGKMLVVSAVGTMQEAWTLSDLADDYATCGRQAVEAGADAVEINFSCPNVTTCDGQLYQDPVGSGVVAERVRAAIGSTPLIIKIGHLTDAAVAAELVQRLTPLVTAIAMTNSVATHVLNADQRVMFEGQLRGICGAAIRDASLAQVRMFSQILAAESSHLEIIGVGGIRSLQDVQEYLAAGAKSTHLATAAMVNPRVAMEIRANW